MFTLKEIVQNANLMVKDHSDDLKEIITQHNLPGNADAIITFIKENEASIVKPSEEEYAGLLGALKKRREVSLKATYAGIATQLLPNQYTLKNLDNNNNNLQSEKNIEEETPMADEELSQDEIEALLAGNAPADNDASDEMSNDDIEALLNEAASEESGTSSQSDELSQDDIEALLAGNATEEESAELNQDDIQALLTDNTTDETPKEPEVEEESAELNQDDIESLLAGNPEVEPEEKITTEAKEEPLESEMISEDDIQDLLDSQFTEPEDLADEKDDGDDIQALLEAQEKSDAKEEQPATSEGVLEKEEETRIPSGVFPSTANIEDIMGQEEPETTPIPVVVEEAIERREESPAIANIQPTTFTPEENIKNIQINAAPSTSYQELAADGDVRERLLQDVYALYVNTGGKPILQTECATKDEIKKVYMAAIQNFPQNSLFIEKISRKEIIVVKESREIINLKVNISFE